MFNSVASAPVSDKSIALDVNASSVEEYGFEVGVTVLEGLLSSLNLGELGIKAKIGSFKSMSTSYSKATVDEVPAARSIQYLMQADLAAYPPAIRTQLNNDRFILISGIMYGEGLKVSIETKVDISAEVIVELNQIAEGKLNFTMSTARSLTMNAEPDQIVPIAVKAHRMLFNRNELRDLRLVTDNRNFF
jgi:hypothetical protein